jgi:hypothetical protein
MAWSLLFRVRALGLGFLPTLGCCDPAPSVVLAMHSVPWVFEPACLYFVLGSDLVCFKRHPDGFEASLGNILVLHLAGPYTVLAAWLLLL